MSPGPVQIGNLSAEAEAVSQQEDPSPSFSRGRLGVASNPEIGRPAQVVLPLGRSIRRQSSSQEQCILPHRLEKADSICGHFKTRNGAPVECRAAMPVLQLSGIIVLLFMEMLLT